MRPKRGWSSEFLPASEPRTDISFEYLVPAVFRVFHGRIGWFCWKGVVQNADETPRSEFLRLEPVTGLGKGNFNASGKDTSTPGVGGCATRENAGGEVFLGKGRVFIIYELAKVLGGEVTLALSGFDMLGNIRNRAKQGIARGALVGGFLFGLVDLGVVLAREKALQQWKRRRVENKPDSSEDQAPQQYETPESTQGKPSARNSPPHAPSTPPCP